MTAGIQASSRRLWVSWLPIGVVVSVISLAWLGYRAITEWQRSAGLVAQRSADAAVDLLFTAVTRDMRGVQTTVLTSLQFDDPGPSADLDLNTVASAFARYPYPEAFFASRMTSSFGPIAFYSRASRHPAWLSDSSTDTPFPVVSATYPRLSDVLLDRISRDARERKTLTAFNQAIEGVDYQVVALLSYADSAREKMQGVFGFVVNLEWVRSNYFQELTSQVGRIRGAEAGLRLAVMDGHGTILAGATPHETEALTSTRRFPMLFFDPGLIELDPPPDLTNESWIARASITDDHALMAARNGARITLALASISALVLAGGLALSVRAALARARLTDMRSDFVAAVTHDLKTPIATIRAISETFVSRANVDPTTLREYGQIAVHEAKRLTRLIDNLLAYARISDVTDAYSFEAISLRAIVQSSLKEFRWQLESAGFNVVLEIPDDLPRVRADGQSLALAIGNILENAIRYSGDGRTIALIARSGDGAVRLDVTDQGTGIPPDEIHQVTQRFFRGSGAIAGGSGLGLSIAQRIISDHSGSLSIQSAIGIGTTVRVSLPVAQVHDDETHLDC